MSTTVASDRDLEVYENRTLCEINWVRSGWARQFDANFDVLEAALVRIALAYRGIVIGARNGRREALDLALPRMLD